MNSSQNSMHVCMFVDCPQQTSVVNKARFMQFYLRLSDKVMILELLRGELPLMNAPHASASPLGWSATKQLKALLNKTCMPSTIEATHRTCTVKQKMVLILYLSCTLDTACLSYQSVCTVFSPYTFKPTAATFKLLIGLLFEGRLISDAYSLYLHTGLGYACFCIAKTAGQVSKLSLTAEIEIDCAQACPLKVSVKGA